MSDLQDHAVLVVGAGPVGLTMAAELARYGLAVRIVDKAPARTDKSKALVVWSRTLELLDRSGCGEAFVAAGAKVDAVRITAGTKEIARVAFAGAVTPHPYALMLPQSETERILEEHLATLGIEVERQVELTRCAAGADRVDVTLQHLDGRVEQVHPSWLIGCDGAHSTTRHEIGLEFEGDTLPSDWILADVHVAGLSTPPSELDMYWHADGVLALFPISPGRYRVIADVGATSSPVRRPDPTLDEVQALVDRRGPGRVTVSDPVWLSAFRINERMVRSYRAGRVFLAGDAAHIHSPAGGQGMNTGMQDAFNLAWKLALVEQGRGAQEPLLDSYSIERSAVGRRVLADTGRATALAVMRGAAMQVVRNHVASLLFGLSPVRRAMVNTLTELAVGYPHSPLTERPAQSAVRPGSGGPGARVPGSSRRIGHHTPLRPVRAALPSCRRADRTAPRSARARLPSAIRAGRRLAGPARRLCRHDLRRRWLAAGGGLPSTHHCGGHVGPQAPTRGQPGSSMRRQTVLR